MAPRKAIKEPAPAICPFSDGVTIGAEHLGGMRWQAPLFEPKSEKKALKDAISFDYKPMDDKRLYLDNDKRFFVEVNPKPFGVAIGFTIT